MIAALFQYRRLIWRHALADVRHRYAGSGMGVVWNVIHPLAMLSVYAAVFSGMMGAKLKGHENNFLAYTVWLCAGFFPWIGFSDCIARGSTAFTHNAAYLKKLPIPEPVFAAQSAVSATISLVISMALLVVIAMVLGESPRLHWLALPLPLILLMAVGFGFGLVAGTLNVFFSDVSQIVGIIIHIAFWLTPIVYVVDSIPMLTNVVPFHPATPAIAIVRALFLEGQWPEAGHWLSLGAWAVATPLVGGLVLRALRAEIRDVI